ESCLPFVYWSLSPYCIRPEHPVPRSAPSDRRTAACCRQGTSSPFHSTSDMQMSCDILQPWSSSNSSACKKLLPGTSPARCPLLLRPAWVPDTKRTLADQRPFRCRPQHSSALPQTASNFGAELAP